VITSDEGIHKFQQHTQPCSDCPWRRKSLPGWLGPNSAQDWVDCARSDNSINCHVIVNQQCAGAAIYRRNIAKCPRPPNLILPANRDDVFANSKDFIDHHTLPTIKSVKSKRNKPC
jgi:hypothetical protein